jgi:hypothetical protein
MLPTGKRGVEEIATVSWDPIESIVQIVPVEL